MKALILVAASMSACLAAPPWKDGFITTGDGERIHYIEAGSGPAILFVPGWTMPAEIWEPQVRGLSDRFRVVAMDPRSQGRSDSPSEGHQPERRAADIKDVVDQLHLAPAAVAGWSLAVSELLEYVDRFGTSTLRALILVDGQIGSDPTVKGLVGTWQWLRTIQADRRTFTDQFVRSMYKKPQSEEYLKRMIDASLLTPTNSAVVLLGNLFMGGDWRGVLPKIDRPVLVPTTPRLTRQADLVKAAVPSARIEIFEDAGHALFVDDAERFNALLADFLK